MRYTIRARISVCLYGRKGSSIYSCAEEDFGGYIEGVFSVGIAWGEG